MKKSILLIVSLLVFAGVYAQEIPQVQVKDINGKVMNTKDIIQNEDKPVLICFFATWCKPCIKELTAINDLYEDWTDETGVKVIAISIDDARSTNSVGPFVNARGWEFEVYLDSNGDFKRAMNVANPPHSFIVDGKGNIVWQHNSYLEGDEEKVYEVLKKVVDGEEIKE